MSPTKKENKSKRQHHRKRNHQNHQNQKLKRSLLPKKAECKKNGLVYDVKTKNCRQRKKKQTVNKTTAANPVKLTLLGNCRKERLEYLKKGIPEYFTKQIETVSLSKVKSIIEQKINLYIELLKKMYFVNLKKIILKR